MACGTPRKTFEIRYVFLGHRNRIELCLCRTFEVSIYHIDFIRDVHAACNMTLISFCSNKGENARFNDKGCSIFATNKSHTTCTCNHMTSFAVLTRVDSDGPNSVSFMQGMSRSALVAKAVNHSQCGSNQR